METNLGPLALLAFAFLVLERHRPVTHDELAEVLWGEAPPRSWSTSLRGIVSRLRAVLASVELAPNEVLTSSNGCYQLRLPNDAVVDVEAADSAVAEAGEQLHAGRPDRARGAAEAAVAVAAGQFVPGGRGLWAEQRQAELRAVHLHALELLADACSRGGSHEAAVRAAEEAVTLEPLRESSYRRLLLVHAAAGNRAEALRAYKRCRDVLADELGVTPSAATEAAYSSLLGDEAAPPTGGMGTAPDRGAPALGNARSRLPLTTFVGRAERVGEVGRLLASSRLVTLTGPGGVGKSRLALEAAAALAASFPGGVHLVELAPLAEPSLLTRHVLSAVGIAEEPGRDDMETLAAHLGGQARLLILDNCEHLVAGCADLADALVRWVPDLRVLVTSREPLGVPGETRWVVPSLSTPEPGAAVAAVAASDLNPRVGHAG